MFSTSVSRENILGSHVWKGGEGSRIGHREKSSWELARMTASAESVGSSRAKMAHLSWRLSAEPHSVLGCGLPREGHDLGQVRSVAEAIPEGADSWRLSAYYTPSSWGDNLSSRKELWVAHLCVCHTGCGEREGSGWQCSSGESDQGRSLWLGLNSNPEWNEGRSHADSEGAGMQVGKPVRRQFWYFR